MLGPPPATVKERTRPRTPYNFRQVTPLQAIGQWRPPISAGRRPVPGEGPAEERAVGNTTAGGGHGMTKAAKTANSDRDLLGEVAK